MNGTPPASTSRCLSGVTLNGVPLERVLATGQPLDRFDSDAKSREIRDFLRSERAIFRRVVAIHITTKNWSSNART